MINQKILKIASYTNNEGLKKSTKAKFPTNKLIVKPIPVKTPTP